jgi:2-dehydropantoate 2-reductase
LKLLVIGAGSVGLNLGARLARAGCKVHFVARSPQAARAIRREGVRVIDPETGQAWRVRAQAVAGVEDAAELLREVPALLCTRASDTESVATSIARSAPGATLVSAQNDVDNEEKLARYFPVVIGLCLRQTCTRVGSRAVRALGGGRVVIGAHPGPGSPGQATADGTQAGSADTVEALADAFRRAGYDVGISRRIAEDKWLKLCVNLMSAPNALVVRSDHTRWAFVEVKARLLEEARTALAAAGITARSCDGRDRSLEEEIHYQRESLALGTSARRAKVYNAVWMALHSGAALEADRYHQRILDLARAHGLAAPTNQRVLQTLQRAAREALGPESLRAAELLAQPVR